MSNLEQIMTGSLRYYAVGEVYFSSLWLFITKYFLYKVQKHFMLHYQGMYSVLLGEGVYSSSILFSLLTLHRSCVKFPLLISFNFFLTHNIIYYVNLKTFHFLSYWYHLLN